MLWSDQQTLLIETIPHCFWLRRVGRQMSNTEQLLHQTDKSSHRRRSIKKAILKNFTIFTGKHICWRTSGYCCFWIDFRKWLFGTLFLGNRFQNHPDSVISQKYQSLSKQRFNHSLAHVMSLYLTPSKYNTNEYYVLQFDGSPKVLFWS